MGKGSQFICIHPLIIDNFETIYHHEGGYFYYIKNFYHTEEAYFAIITGSLYIIWLIIWKLTEINK